MGPAGNGAKMIQVATAYAVALIKAEKRGVTNLGFPEGDKSCCGWEMIPQKTLDRELPVKGVDYKHYTLGYGASWSPQKAI
jgi:hypothetical protein